MYSFLVIDANCNSVFTPEALDIIRELLGYFKIIAPLLVIVLIALDYARGVIAQDNDALKKANSRVAFRLIALVLLFFVPVIVTAILDLTSFSSFSTDYLCTNATGTVAESKTVFVIEKPKDKNSSNTKIDSSTAKNTSTIATSSDSSSNGNGSSSNSGTSNSYAKVGSQANSKNSVCLKNQSGARDIYQSELEAKINAASTSRGKVVASAIYISSEIGIKIPYFPGGCHSMSCLTKGIPNNIGCQAKVSHNAYKWPATLPSGFDCSGFTFWTYGSVFGQKAYISSEMHNASANSTTVIDPSTGKKIGVKVEKVDNTKANHSYIKSMLLPGDLVGHDGHIGMVVDVSLLQSEGKFTVAHASSQYMQLVVQTYKLTDKKWTRFLLMRKFFLKYDCLYKGSSDACQKFDCISNKSCNSDSIKY